MTTILECMFTAIQDEKHFLLYTLRKSETLKGKVHTFQTGTTGVMWSNSNGYGMVCHGDRWWGGGVRCEDDVSEQLDAAVKSPFESAVGERGQVTPLRTALLPSLFPSTPGCT